MMFCFSINLSSNLKKVRIAHLVLFCVLYISDFRNSYVYGFSQKKINLNFFSFFLNFRKFKKVYNKIHYCPSLSIFNIFLSIIKFGTLFFCVIRSLIFVPLILIYFLLSKFLILIIDLIFFE